MIDFLFLETVCLIIVAILGLFMFFLKQLCGKTYYVRKAN